MHGVMAWLSVDLDLQVLCSACYFSCVKLIFSLAVRLELKMEDVNFYGNVH